MLEAIRRNYCPDVCEEVEAELAGLRALGEQLATLAAERFEGGGNSEGIWLVEVHERRDVAAPVDADIWDKEPSVFSMRTVLVAQVSGSQRVFWREKKDKSSDDKPTLITCTPQGLVVEESENGGIHLGLDACLGVSGGTMRTVDVERFGGTAGPQSGLFDVWVADLNAHEIPLGEAGVIQMVSVLQLWPMSGRTETHGFMERPRPEVPHLRSLYEELTNALMPIFAAGMTMERAIAVLEK